MDEKIKILADKSEYYEDLLSGILMEQDEPCITVKEALAAMEEYAKAYAPVPTEYKNVISEEQIANILRNNITFSPQVNNYIIHGAIEKLIELFKSWHNSLAAPVPYENVIAYLMNAYNQIIKFGDAEKNDFNANVYFSHAGDINTAMKTLSTYKEFLQPSTASNEDKGWNKPGLSKEEIDDIKERESEKQKELDDEPKAVQQAAEKYGLDNCKSCNDRGYSDPCTCSQLENAFLAGASFNKDAVEFLNFVVKEKFKQYEGGFWSRDNEEGKFTAQELYNLFLANKNSIQQAHDKSTYE